MEAMGADHRPECRSNGPGTIFYLLLAWTFAAWCSASVSLSSCIKYYCIKSWRILQAHKSRTWWGKCKSFFYFFLFCCRHTCLFFPKTAMTSTPPDLSIPLYQVIQWLLAQKVITDLFKSSWLGYMQLASGDWTLPRFLCVIDLLYLREVFHLGSCWIS